MAATLSRWCTAGTLEVDVCESPGSGVWETKPASGHDWCHSERWHDEYHGKDPGCCAGPEERESWACECDCHAEREVSGGLHSLFGGNGKVVPASKEPQSRAEWIEGIMNAELPRYAEALKRLGES